MLNRMMTRWASIVFQYPLRVVVVAVLIALLGGYLASKIKIKSSFATLLPDNSQAVIDLTRINKRIGGMGTVIVSVEGEEIQAMQRFAEDLVKKLKTYPKEEVLYIDYKIDSQQKFFNQNKYLYLSVEEIREIHDEIDKKIKREKAKANPFLIDLSSDEDKKKEPFDFEAKRKKYEKKLKRFDRFIDGYLTNKEGTELIVVLKTPGDATGVDFAIHLVGKLERDIAAMKPKGYHPSLDVNLTGGLKTLPEEYHALRDDIVIVSNLCVMAVLLAVALYYRSIRTTIILSFGLLCGVATTYGLTYLKIGYLTAATAFLCAIVAGNGINFGIYFLSRYNEERKRGFSVPDALARAMTGTIASVSTAAFAAGASYASLMATQFKGFNQFGFIGGVGMIVCLVFALTLDPALCVLTERFFPIEKRERERGRIFSRGAAWLVERHAKKILAIGTAAIVTSTIVLAFFLKDPFEYNYRNLRNQYSQKQGSGKRSGKAKKILGERSSPHIILAESIEQVPKIKEALWAFTDKHPDPEKRVIKNIKTVQDYIPGTVDEQREKIKLLSKIRHMLTRNSFDSLKKADRETLKKMIPPEDLEVIGIESLPEELVRPFVELDGTRGTLVLVYMADGMSVWNGRDLKRFADEVREVTIEGGEKIRSSGKAVVYSDMLKYVADEGPYATAGAFLMVLVVIIVAFRRFRHFALLGTAMLTGVLLMMGVAIVSGQKINFLNYIAIPIQFGIGVDYSVNIYARFLEEGKGSIGRVLRSTGGAVMITSTTTIIGYSALWSSINGAINTFGTLANIGEVTCLVAATLLMPAYLAVFRKGVTEPRFSP